MNKLGGGRARVAVVAIGLTLMACLTGLPSKSSSAARPSQRLTACPTSPAPAPPVGGVPPGIPYAKTIAPSDTSTSIVIDPTGPQIQCGTTQVTTYSDIVYATPSTAGTKVALQLDIQVPKTPGKKRPLVVYIPGGGFRYADKSGALDQRTYLAEQGYSVASIQYRAIANGATYTDSVADVKSAIRYLRAHADQYGIDAERVAVWGQSAGGYLAAMTGVTNGLKQFDVGDNLEGSSAVQAVVDQFGPSDLSKVGADFDTATQQMYTAAGNFLAEYVFGPGTKKSILDDPAAVAAANPATYVNSSNPAFVLFHGSADHLVSPSQTLLMLNALRAKEVESTRYVLLGANHGDLTFMGDPKAVLPWTTRQVMGDIVTFLDERLDR